MKIILGAGPLQPPPLTGIGNYTLLLAFNNIQSILNETAADFAAYFAEGNNGDYPAMLARVADSCGLVGSSLMEQASEKSIKDRLRANT